ncbi:hypothetical protein Bca52824_031159 [Brassica carinata]|uniref:Uncharacterized protein n=1 Tax=Brassica carinata TaxID=52824 RepID=A0A8X7SAH4_BRACI|nr:hypothetical protein Bca52824_031159 [Brassica carinata]
MTLSSRKASFLRHGVALRTTASWWIYLVLSKVSYVGVFGLLMLRFLVWVRWSESAGVVVLRFKGAFLSVAHGAWFSSLTILVSFDLSTSRYFADFRA